MESFLRHINGQVRQGEEQESLMAVAQRIGPYEVLEPSSEEVEKVRKRTPKMQGSRERRLEEKPGGRGPRYLSATSGCVHHSFLWEEPKGRTGRVKRGVCCGSGHRKNGVVTAQGTTAVGWDGEARLHDALIPFLLALCSVSACVRSPPWI